MLSETPQSTTSVRNGMLSHSDHPTGTYVHPSAYPYSGSNNASVWTDFVDNTASIKSLPTPDKNENQIISYLFKKEYLVMKSRIRKLYLTEVEEDAEDVGADRPSQYALNKVEFLLGHAFRMMSNDFYRGAVTTSFEGGIRVEWMRPNASVRLIVSSDKNGNEYIYFESKDEYGSDPVTVENLVRRLLDLKQA